MVSAGEQAGLVATWAALAAHPTENPDRPWRTAPHPLYLNSARSRLDSQQQQQDTAVDRVRAGLCVCVCGGGCCHSGSLLLSAARPPPRSPGLARAGAAHQPHLVAASHLEAHAPQHEGQAGAVAQHEVLNGDRASCGCGGGSGDTRSVMRSSMAEEFSNTDNRPQRSSAQQLGCRDSLDGQAGGRLAATSGGVSSAASVAGVRYCRRSQAAGGSTVKTKAGVVRAPATHSTAQSSSTHSSTSTHTCTTLSTLLKSDSVLAASACVGWTGRHQQAGRRQR